MIPRKSAPDILQGCVVCCRELFVIARLLIEAFIVNDQGFLQHTNVAVRDACFHKSDQLHHILHACLQQLIAMNEKCGIRPIY